MTKRFLATLLALTMVCALLPATALAADSDFTIEGGVLTAYTGPGGNVVIPDGVTTIGEWAFESCQNLTSVTIPNGVTTIGDEAFSDCESLTSVTIPNSVTTIGGIAFAGCQSLTRVTIPNSVTTIEGGAFQHCTSLTSITIPASVTYIGIGVFGGCTALTSITVAQGNPAYTVQDGVLFSKDITELLWCPPQKVGVYNIPASVTDIGMYAFCDCKSLTGITIPTDATLISSDAFSGCTGDFTVAEGNPICTARDGVLFSKDMTFLAQCPAGKKGVYQIPNSVTNIASHAFSGCTGLTSVTIPNNVTSIGASAFEGCTSLTSVTIPAGVTSIGNSAFSGCTGLTSVTIPNSVTSIGNSVFFGCKNLTGVTIPASATGIGAFAFLGCTGLTSVTIPASVTSIGISAFAYCTGLTNITVANGNPSYTSQDGVLFNKDMTTLLQYPAKKAGAYQIPASVTTIGNAFADCTGLTGITIPNSVTGIGGGAFRNCTSLTSITVTNGNSRYTVQDGVLFNKDMTTLVRYPAGKSGAYQIPASVTSIASYAFSGCAGLTGVTIPDSVTNIGGSAFSNCAGLTGVTIPADVTVVGSEAFYGCKSLTGVAIPDSVTVIGHSAFQNCTGLTSATIPNSETAIVRYAFDGCPNLTVYGQSNSEAERYCSEYNIPFVVGIGPGTALTGSLESDTGKSIPWSITAQGKVTIDVAAADLAPQEAVLVGCYDSNGRFTGVKWLDAQHATTQLDPATPTVKLFWLGAKQAPISPSVTVWGK